MSISLIYQLTEQVTEQSFEQTQRVQFTLNKKRALDILFNIKQQIDYLQVSDIEEAKNCYQTR